MDLLLSVLPFALFLACPLMMVACFVGMRKMGCSTSAEPSSVGLPDRASLMSAPDRIAALQAHLTRLETEQAAIAEQIAALSRDAQPIADSATSPVPVPASAGVVHP